MDPTQPPKKKSPIDVIAASLDSLNRSPLPDSLGSGRVSPIMDDSGLLGEYSMGRPSVNINGDFDAPVQGGVPSSGRDLRNAFIHESGHALQATKPEMFPQWNEVAKGLPEFTNYGDYPGWRSRKIDGYTTVNFPNGKSTAFSTDKDRFGEGSLLRSILPFMESGRKMTDTERRAFHSLDPYYTGKIPGQTGDNRSKSNEQFAQAFTNAFGFLSDTAKNPGDYRRRIGELEGATPGMGQIVLDILRQPQFANHPLRSAFGVK